MSLLSGRSSRFFALYTLTCCPCATITLSIISIINTYIILNPLSRYEVPSYIKFLPHSNLSLSTKALRSNSPVGPMILIC